MAEVIDIKTWREARKPEPAVSEIDGLFIDLKAAETALAELRALIKEKLGLVGEG